MKSLENRIPPPIILLLSLGLIWLISRVDQVMVLPTAVRIGGGLLMLVLGIGMSVAGVLSFRKAQTTVNPLKPDTASSLVITGIFNFTRNPMYLGMLFILLGAVLKTSSVLSLIAVAGFYLFINRFQIIPEERAMLELFGEEFRQFQQRVRRWV